MFGGDKSGFQAATQAAKDSELAVVVVGEAMSTLGRATPMTQTDGEGSDVANLDLTGYQEDLIRAIHETGTPTVVVLINGRPLSIRWTAQNMPAIVEAWLPGERGGEAVADVLFGDYNPGGRLAISVPRHSGQLPSYYDYKGGKASRVRRGYVDMPATPLYDFGFGLSYTKFEYANLKIDPQQSKPQGDVKVSVDVKNVGSREGDEVVQLYIHRLTGSVASPVKQLKGFRRVSLRPGEMKPVAFTLTSEDLALLNQDMHWVVEPSAFDIMVGASSGDIRARGKLAVVN